MDATPFLVKPNKPVSLRDFDPGNTGTLNAKQDGEAALAESRARLAKYQDKLYAQNERALLVILQAIDAAGKDGTIKHVMSGVNPMGCQVYSFKAPSPEERDHDYLWRFNTRLPERGRFGLFNRSYYEDVLVTRVHPEFISGAQLPAEIRDDKKIYKRRYAHINAYEEYLVENGITVLKFFLHVSKAEQKKRLLERINDPAKNWKFDERDVHERAHWDEYMRAFEDCFEATSTTHAPWHIIPADNKWFTRYAVAQIMADALKGMNLAYPEVTAEQREALQRAKAALEAE